MTCHLRKTRQYISFQGLPLTSLSSRTNLSVTHFLSPSSYWNLFYNSDILLPSPSGVFSLLIPDKTLAKNSYLTLQSTDINSVTVQNSPNLFLMFIKNRLVFGNIHALKNKFTNYLRMRA